MVAKGLAGKKFSSGGARQPWWRERFWDPSQILLGSDLGLARALLILALLFLLLWTYRSYPGSGTPHTMNGVMFDDYIE